MAPILTLLTLLSLSLSVAAQGNQFITGVCTSDAICASGCCGFTSGKCAAPFVANERGEGCGFGDAQPNNNALNGAADADANAGSQIPATAPEPPAARPTKPEPPSPSKPPTTGSGKAPGAQFITGVCSSDADCAAGCCGFNSGKCAGPVVAQQRDGGCGFGDAQPNDNVAKVLQGRKLGRRGVALM